MNPQAIAIAAVPLLQNPPHLVSSTDAGIGSYCLRSSSTLPKTFQGLRMVLVVEMGAPNGRGASFMRSQADNAARLPDHSELALDLGTHA
jgi:hypothetical protein